LTSTPWPRRLRRFSRRKHRTQLESRCANQFEHLSELRRVLFVNRAVNDDDVICSVLAEQAGSFSPAGCRRDMGSMNFRDCGRSTPN
jgi:hypothetical protein